MKTIEVGCKHVCLGNCRRVGCNCEVRRVSSGFIAAGGGGFALLFDERNVNGECKYDNGFNETHLVLYKRGLDERYGAGTSDHLEERYRDFHFKGKTTKEWSKKEYEAKIQDLKEKLAAL